MKNAFSRFVVGCLTFTLLSACGGGGGGGGGNQNPAPPPGDPFGLTTRAPLANFQLPGSIGSGSGNFSLVNAYPNIALTAPLFLAGVPDGSGRVAVLERGGRMLTFTDSASANDLREVLNITGRVVTDAEQGLLGLAFDPDFATNRYIYLHYSIGGPMRSIIARMTWNPTTDLVDTGTEKIILTINQPQNNHNGGMLAFGPDDYLYIGIGDGGGAGDTNNNAQNTNSMLGKMLRLDVHPPNDADPYRIPLDNPFVGDPNTLDEIYALGLRNPWRFSFDRQTGDLWLGDVGQDAIEEIDIITSGGNYGWRVFEGTQVFNRSGNSLPDSAFTPPVYEYGRSEGRSITGGYVYRGTRFASLSGRYVYGDASTGNVWALTWNGSAVTDNQLLGNERQIVSFGETNSGEIVAVSFQGSLWGLEESGGGGGGQIPTQLSQTGLFTNLNNLTPASGLIEYTPNHPFWSDYTVKRRWIGIPDSSRVDFSSDDWTFPVGTVSVKHFEIALDEGTPSQTTRLETRVLVNTSSGWEGITYRWNNSGTEANLLTGRETTTLDVTLAGGGTRTQRYDFPSRTDCIACHTPDAGFVLGVKTPQLNGDFNYGSVVDNQLRSWNNINLFDTNIGDADDYDAYPALDDATASVTSRARAYLEVNCSQCHQPGGTTPTNLDLRALTPQGAMNAVNVAPSAGDLGVANARIIARGEKERSVLWLRMQELDAQRMPPLSTHVIDEEGVELIGSWIDSL